MVIVPLVGRSSVVSIWIVVVLPAPLGPRNAKISPACTSNEMPSTAATSPKVLTRFCTWIMGPSLLADNTKLFSLDCQRRSGRAGARSGRRPRRSA